MKIALLAPIEETVPPKKYCGTVGIEATSGFKKLFIILAAPVTAFNTVVGAKVFGILVGRNNKLLVGGDMFPIKFYRMGILNHWR